MVNQMGSFHVSVFTGDLFDTNASPIVPTDSHLVEAIWAFTTSGEFRGSVRAIDAAHKVTNGTLVKVPFDGVLA